MYFYPCLSKNSYFINFKQKHQRPKFNMQPHHAMMEEYQQSFDTFLFVCGLDFGITYSCFAFSSVNYVSEITVPACIADLCEPRIVSYKIPTSLLLDHSENFLAFGYEAESRYADLELDGDHIDYFYREKPLLDLRKEVHHYLNIIYSFYKQISTNKEKQKKNVVC